MRVHELIVRLNRAFESSCYKVGRLIGRFPWVVLGLVIIFCLALSAGLAGMETEDEIFELWIEKGSRVHGEREFVTDHYSRILSRVEALIGLPKDRGTFLNAETLDDYLKMTERLEALSYNHTMPDGTQRSFRLEDVCLRTSAPVLLHPIFGLAELKGLPCTRTLPLDCYQEGGYDFNLGDIMDNPYTLKPSLYGKNPEDLADIVQPGCGMWHELPIPENFLFGGVELGQRSSGGPEKILGVESGQSTVAVMTGAQLFTSSICPEPCRQDCTEGVTEDIDTCVDEGRNCVFACMDNEPEETKDACLDYNSCLLSTCLSDDGEGGQCEDPYSELCEECQQGCLDAIPDDQDLEGCIQCTADCGAAGEACIATRIEESIPCYYACDIPCQNPTAQEEAEMDAILDAWELTLIQDLEATKESYPHLTPTYMFVRSVDDLVDDATSASVGLIFMGYVFMIAYASLSLMRCGNALESKFAVGLSGVLLVAIAVVASMGVFAMAGYRFDSTAIQVLPFLGLGLGTNNLFVLVSMFRYHPTKSAAEMTGKTLSRAGPSVSLTSMTNFIAFAIGSSIPLPAVSNFCVAMLLVVFLNYIVLFFGFTAILTINARRMQRGRADCFCWRPTASVAHRPGEGDGTVARFAASFSRFVFRKPVQIMVIVGAILIASFSVLGAQDLKVGLPLSDSIPSSSYVAPLLREREKNYGDFDSGLIIGYDSEEDRHVQLDYHTPTVMRQILDLERAMASEVPHMHPLFKIQDGSWADLFVLYLNFGNFTDSPLEDRVDLSEPYPMVVEGEEVPAFLPNPDNFYSFLQEWVQIDGIPFKDQIEWSSTSSSPLIHSLRIVYFQTQMNDIDRILDHLKIAREVCDASPIPAFTAGLVVDTYTQFMNVEKYLGSSMGYIAIGVSLTGLLFLFHPGAVAIMVGVIALTLFEIYGYMSYFGIDLNGVCIVNLLMAAGMCVEFTAHLTRVFLVTSADSKIERAQIAVEKMVIPLSNSAISTFLGVFPLAFSFIPYFRLYFWNMLVCIILFGLYNGLFLLPVLLAYIGPATIPGIGDGLNDQDGLLAESETSSDSNQYRSLAASDQEAISMDSTDLYDHVPQTKGSSIF